MTAPPLPSVENLARQLLLDLISVHTPAGRESENLPVLLPFLKGMGADIHVHEVEPGRTNVLALWGRPQVLFSTHLDVVPGQLPIFERDGVIYGRGSCDAKGQAVAQLLAIKSLLDEGHRGLAWMGVCGEETDSIGAREAFCWKNHFDACRVLINGEPTEGHCGTGQRGVLHLRLICKGKAAHSGSPERGRSATFALLDWLEALRGEASPVDPELGPEVWNLGRLNGGTAPNVIPDSAQAEILVRTIPASRFKERVAAAAPADAIFEVLLEEPCDSYPTIDGFSMAPMPYGSDAPQLRGLIPGGTVVLAGPGTIHVAHTDHEHLSLQDLMAGIVMNKALALHFVNQ